MGFQSFLRASEDNLGEAKEGQTVVASSSTAYKLSEDASATTTMPAETTPMLFKAECNMAR